MCLLFVAGSGGPASRACCGAPHLFLWPPCLSALLGPLRAGVAPLSLAALAVPRFLGAVLWLFFSASRCLALRALVPRLCLPLGRWLLFGGFSPPPLPFLCLAVFVAPAWCLGVFFFFFFFFPFFPCAPPLSPAFSGFGPRVPWASALCVVCSVGLPPLGSPCACPSFVLSAWLVVAPRWLLPPPPFLSRGFRGCRSVLCAVCCVVLCLLGCGAAPRCCALCPPVLCCPVMCCARWVPVLVAPCPPALPVALGPCALRRCVLRCSPVLCVFCRGAVVRAVVRCSALCCVCPGVLCCAFPVLSALCGAVLRCACGSRCAVRVVRAVAGAWCCGVPWCGAGSGGPWFPAGGVFRCRCPCLAAWSVSLVVGVVCCGALLSCVVFCGAVLSRGAVLLYSAVVLRCCWGLLCAPVGCRAVLCCAVGWLCCFLPGGGVCVLWCSFPRAVCSLSSPFCALRCLVVLAVVLCFPVSCAVALCCRVVLCCRALLSFCGAVCVGCGLWAVVLCCVVLLVGCADFCPVVVSECCGALFLVLCVPCLLRSVRCGALLPCAVPRGAVLPPGAVVSCPAALLGVFLAWVWLYLLEKPLQNFVKYFFSSFFFFFGLLKIK